MKKKFVYLLAAAMTLSGSSFIMTSCGDDDPSSEIPTPPNGGDTPTPSNPVGNKELSSKEQKEKLETVAKAFMNELKADNFTSLKDLAEYCYEEYIDNEDFDNGVVTKWFDAALEASSSFAGTKKDTWGSWVESRKLYNRILQLSNFTGHFTAEKGTWKKTNANDLQFNFTDQNGKACNITIASSGNLKKAYVGTTEDWNGWYKDDKTDQYIEEIEQYEEYIMVPEQITVTLTQGGTKQIETIVNIDHSAFNGPEADLAKDGLVTNVTAKVADFTWVVQRAEYSSKNKNAAVNGYMKKGNTTMLTFSADANKLDVTNEAFNDAGTANVSIDVLGQMQIKGSCSDVKKYVELLDNADENDENESAFKGYINQANNLLNISVYYDKGSVQQASIKLIPMLYESKWSSYKYWYTDPAVYFNDGTSYSFENYFNEKDFRSVIDVFNDIIRGYEDLLDE